MLREWRESGVKVGRRMLFYKKVIIEWRESGVRVARKCYESGMRVLCECTREWQRSELENGVRVLRRKVGVKVR